MSKEEFERADRQVMWMVNGIPADAVKAGTLKQNPAVKNRRLPQLLIVRVLTCLALAALFLLAILDPAFATAMGYLGVLVSCIVGAIILDRYFRR